MSQAENNGITQLVEKARGGDRDAIGRLLEHYRSYLRGFAQRRLARDLARRCDASDIVQQTFLDAHQNFASFAGSDEPELLAWLRRILTCNLANAIRDHFVAQKRALGNERSLDDSSRGGNGAARIADDASSPSRRLIRTEEALRFLEALQELPVDQSAAVRLRHLEGLSIAEIAADLGRSPAAAAGLVKRGMQGLRRLIDEGEQQ